MRRRWWCHQLETRRTPSKPASAIQDQSRAARRCHGRQQRPQRVERHVPAGHRETHHPGMGLALELNVRDGAGALLLPVQQGAR